MDARTIKNLLKSECTLFVKDSVTSTNDEVALLLKQAPPSEMQRPVVVVSGQQTAGRGRLGRTWSSPPGGLYISFSLELQAPLHQVMALPLVLALATRKALQELSAAKVCIKWPNDLLVGSGKLCGILVETNGSALIVGIGINVVRPDEQIAEQVVGQINGPPVEPSSGQAATQPAYLSDASDSKSLLAGEFSLEKIAAAVIDEAFEYIDSWRSVGFDFSSFQDDYQRELLLMGREVVVHDLSTAVGSAVSGTLIAQGTVIGVQADGRLLVENRGFVSAISAGDVTLKSL